MVRKRCIERESQHVSQLPEHFDERRGQECEIIVMQGDQKDVKTIQTT